MNKIKPVLPSLREKKRYLVFEIISENKIDDSRDVSNAISDECLRYLGESGMAKAGIIFLNNKYDTEKQRGIIKVSHKMVDGLKASLCFVKEINKQPVIIKSIGVSGILKKAQNKYIAA